MPRYERPLIALLTLLHALFAAGFALSAPPFEAPDEVGHYAHVRRLVETGGLVDPYSRTTPPGQYHQAPLYYLLAAPPAALVGDDGDFAAMGTRLNPYFPYQFEQTGSDNKNQYLHYRAEVFPSLENRTARAVYALRLLSVALGALTMLAAYAVYRELWREDAAARLLALAVTAFFPQVTYLSGMINNDNLLILASTVSVALMLRQVRAGFTTRDSLLLGAALAAAALTKVNGLLLALPAAVMTCAGLWDAYRAGGRAAALRALRYPALTVALVLLGAGWWYARNWALYGDPFNFNALYEVWGGSAIRGQSVALDVALAHLPFVYAAFWARFGAGVVPVHPLMYTFFDLLTLASAAGLVVLMVRGRGAAGHARTQVALVAVFVLTWVAGLLYYSGREWTGNQSRYLFPGVAGWSALVAAGVLALTPRRRRAWAAGALSVTLAGVLALALFGYYLPAFRPLPAPPDAATRPALYTFAVEGVPVLELLGASPVEARGRPGEVLRVTLVWRALSPAPSNLLLALHTMETTLVRRVSHPATGNLLASDWVAGQVWAETWLVPLPDDAPPQTVYTLIAGLYDPAVPDFIDASDANTPLIIPRIGRLAVSGVPGDFAAPQFTLGDAVGIADARAARTADGAQVCLTWQVRAAMTRDYHVFLHLYGADGALLTQADTQPRAGGYPTGVWAAGESVADCLAIPYANVPDGARVAFGLYDLETQARLPVRDVAGAALPDGIVWLAVGG